MAGCKSQWNSKVSAAVMNVSFGPFRFESDTRQLLRDGRPVHLAPKAFDLLQLLLERRPAVVTKAEVLEHIWPGTFVEDANLSVLVADIRRALDDDPRSPSFIRTVHGRGYAFSGPAVDASEVKAPPTVSSPRCWVMWGEQKRPLAEGENVLGRDPGCDVWIDARGVSRRHARISVGPDAILVEDLGSTNGTFVGKKKVTAPRLLEDGDLIALGPETLTFRVWPGGASATERVNRRR
jgi:DNA-binding winged helix-turn-helix (wHTH) protein